MAGRRPKRDLVEEAIQAIAKGEPLPGPPKLRKIRSDKGKRAGVMPPPSGGPLDLSSRVASVGVITDAVSIARRTYKEFPDFMRASWRVAIPGSPTPTRLQDEIADYIANGPSRRMLLGFRGVAKSYIAADWIVWMYLHDEEHRVKYLSGSEDKVSEFSGFAKSLLSNPGLPFLRKLAPGGSSRDSAFSWDVGPASRQQSPSFSGNPVLSAIQGGRCNTGIGDDCEQKSNSISDLMRQRLITRIMDMGSMMIPEKKQHFLILGTYQTPASIYDRIIKERGFDVMYVPARVPKDVKVYDGKLAPSIAARAADKEQVGKPTETRFGEAQLRVHERECGPIQWQLEWMMSTRTGDRYEHPFPLERVIVWDQVNPHGAPIKIVPGSAKDHQLDDLPCLGLAGDGWFKPAFVDASTMLPYGTLLMAIDPAGSAGVDEAAFAIVGAVQGQLHVLDIGGFTNGVDPKTLRRLAAVAKKWKVREIVYENNLQAWGSLFEQALREADYGCRTEGVRAVTSKTSRILAIEPVLYGGQLIISRKALESEFESGVRSNDPRWQERLLQFQMAMFRQTERDGGIEYDDRLDALALAVNHLHERFLKTSADMAAAQHQQEAESDRFGEWADSVFGDGTREEALWCRVRP